MPKDAKQESADAIKSVRFQTTVSTTPRTWVELSATPKFKNETSEQRQNRFLDQELRRFEVKASLGKSSLPDHELDADFGPNDGQSYIAVDTDIDHLEIEHRPVAVRFDVNEDNEISTASAQIDARSHQQAIAIFNEELTGYVDRMSYLGGIPIHVIRMVAHDTKNHVKTAIFVAPPKHVSAGEGLEVLSFEMKPIYALYREAMNTTSPFYRLLCLYKILEGLLGPLRTSINRDADKLGIRLSREDTSVPDHPNFPSEFKAYVGKPIKTLYDRVLRNVHRDAMAHFTLDGKIPLDVSAMAEFVHFTDAAFCSDLCARSLIRRHEIHLAQILEAERSADNR